MEPRDSNGTPIHRIDLEPHELNGTPQYHSPAPT